jgi:ribosome-binding protein aMBF1 (putative translation factor)
MAKQSAALNPSSKLNTPVPQSIRSGLKTGSLAPQHATSHSIADAIGAQVRNLRRKLDLNGAELAEQAGLSAGMLSKIEHGAVSASIDSLEALARAQRSAHHIFCELRGAAGLLVRSRRSWRDH